MSVPFFARALFDYEAVESSELSVLAEDFLTVEEVNESGWCLARKGEANGWLPTDYVQRIESDLGVIEPIGVSKPANSRETVATEASAVFIPHAAVDPAAAAVPAPVASSSSPIIQGLPLVEVPAHVFEEVGSVHMNDADTTSAVAPPAASVTPEPVPEPEVEPVIIVATPVAVSPPTPSANSASATTGERGRSNSALAATNARRQADAEADAALKDIAAQLAAAGIAAPPALTAATKSSSSNTSSSAAASAASAPAQIAGGSVAGSVSGSGSAPPKAATTDASGAPLKICHFCKEGIRSAFVMAKNLPFHPNHFQCVTCHCELGGRAYMEKDEQFYCENDYYTMFNPKCGQCNEVIKGAYISALDQSWHPEHFVCTHCSEPFGGNQFRKHDNKPYCEKHFDELFAPKCCVCSLGISGQVFEALDKKYHLDCFKCAADDKPIGEGVMFHVHENKVYCPTHFEKMFLQVCKGCNDVIRGPFLKVMDQHFHAECWKCTSCKCVLASSNCAVDGSDFYCKTCLSKKRASVSPAASTNNSTTTTTTTTTSTKSNSSITGSGGAAVQQQMGSNPQASGDVSQDKAAAALAAIQARQAAQASATAAAAANANAGPSSTSNVFAEPGSKFYPYSVLKDKSSKPADVDPTRKEAYLSDDEFKQIFHLSKDEFKLLPAWKQKNLKTPLALF